MKRIIAAIKKHPWRYVAMAAGFALFVYPAAFLIRAAFWAQGSTAMPDLHKACFRMPFDWLVAGNVTNFVDRPFLIGFLGVVLVGAFFFGPLFCGWLCPVGTTSELASRTTPKKVKINLTRKVNPTAIRYGFLAAFVAVAAGAAFIPDSALASICCRYCASAQLQTLVNGIFDPSSLAYFHSGGIMVIGGWLFLGGLFWKGGRGWCLYGCPLGAISNISHSIGAKMGFTYKIKHDTSKCVECGKCEEVCPTWAINRESGQPAVNRHTCNTCLECVKECPTGSYKYTRGS
ncbi:4Fe-4S binding protein [Dehalogenimonas sp. THU2]|uniref:4Fe-4S binding protein n=1 Tax=Dehalogenimonas sp. THU2 TaxID=3151121 RepID=UPI0032186EF9